jgi:hypothetical protein
MEAPPTGAAAAAAAAAASLHDWPMDVVRLLIAGHPKNMLPTLRLVSKTFEMCIAPSITALNIKAWPQQQQQQQQQLKTGSTASSATAADPPQRERLQFVSRVELSAPEMRLEHWAQLQHITRQLPLLQHLRIHSRMAKGAPLVPKGTTAACVAALSNLTRLDMPGSVFNINVPQPVQLPALRAASFGVVLGTAKLAAFAPYLQQVRVRRSAHAHVCSTAAAVSTNFALEIRIPA